MSEKKMKAKSETKKCKFCKSEIPGDAKVCPACRKKQGGGCLKWGIIAVIILFALGAAGGSLGEKPKQVSTKEEGQGNSQKQESSVQEKEETGQEKEEPVQEQENPVQEKDTFAMGETAELNNVQVTMTNYQETAGSEWNAPGEGNIFVLVEFEIANNSDSEIAVSSMVSFEAYADDYAANLSLGALIENEQNQLDGTIAPGKKMRGWVGYEIPAGWSNLEIHFTDNVWSNNKFKFEIVK